MHQIFREMTEPVVLPATESHPHTTTIWPPGTTLAEMGYRAVKKPAHKPKQKEATMKTAIEEVNTLAAAKRASNKELGEAEAVTLVLAEKPELYRQYREEMATAPPPRATEVIQDSRQFAGDGDSFRSVEQEIESRVDALLAGENNLAPTASDRIEAANRIVASDPELYARHRAAHRAAIGR